MPDPRGDQLDRRDEAAVATGGDSELSHLDDHGHARMVDVTGKAVTPRRAVARCVVRASDEAIAGLRAEGSDTVDAARISGVQAAKITSQLVPLCHPIPVDEVSVDIDVHEHVVEIGATATVVERTGVEMEALTACGIAGLTVAMALLGSDPCARVDELTLWHKSGGRSGTWSREELADS